MLNAASVSFWENLLRAGLEEDGWPWDWTSLGANESVKKPAKKAIGVRVVAKSAGVWAASPLLDVLTGGKKIAVSATLKDGDVFRPGQTICRWKGAPGEVLALERPFLNLAAYACGIATQTHELVQLVKASCPRNPPRVVSTRKTLPGYRDLAIHAVRAGGGFPHRISLAGGVLIKENHIAAAGGISAAVTGARCVAPHGLKIEVEVRDLRELEQSLKAGAEAVLLDNFSVSDVRRAVVLLKERAPTVVVEVSGGIHAGNISGYAQPGVDVISVGSLTHSVKAVDLSMLADGISAK